MSQLWGQAKFQVVAPHLRRSTLELNTGREFSARLLRRINVKMNGKKMDQQEKGPSCFRYSTKLTTSRGKAALRVETLIFTELADSANELPCISAGHSLISCNKTLEQSESLCNLPLVWPPVHSRVQNAAHSLSISLVLPMMQMNAICMDRQRPASSPLDWCQMAARFHPAEVVRRHYEPPGPPKKRRITLKATSSQLILTFFSLPGKLTELSCEPGGVCTCSRPLFLARNFGLNSIDSPP